jgi:hypothetical protein
LVPEVDKTNPQKARFEAFRPWLHESTKWEQGAIGYRVFCNTFVQGAIGYRVIYVTFVQVFPSSLTNFSFGYHRVDRWGPKSWKPWNNPPLQFSFPPSRRRTHVYCTIVLYGKDRERAAVLPCELASIRADSLPRIEFHGNFGGRVGTHGSDHGHTPSPPPHVGPTADTSLPCRFDFSWTKKVSSGWRQSKASRALRAPYGSMEGMVCPARIPVGHPGCQRWRLQVSGVGTRSGRRGRG